MLVTQYDDTSHSFSHHIYDYYIAVTAIILLMQLQLLLIYYSLTPWRWNTPHPFCSLLLADWKKLPRSLLHEADAYPSLAHLYLATERAPILHARWLFHKYAISVSADFFIDAASFSFLYRYYCYIALIFKSHSRFRISHFIILLLQEAYNDDRSHMMMILAPMPPRRWFIMLYLWIASRELAARHISAYRPL